MNTKEIEVAGQKYKIRKMTLGIRQQFMKLQRDGADANELEAFIIYNCVVEPKFESIEKAKELDFDVADELSWQISDFSKPSEDFLRRSANLLSQATSTPKTQ